jgi:hypothetical protein
MYIKLLKNEKEKRNLKMILEMEELYSFTEYK